MEEKEIFKVIDDSNNVLDGKVITRLKNDDKEYIIYSIEDLLDTRDVEVENKKALIMAARITKDEKNNEVYTNLIDEEEKRKVYELFSNTYKECLKN